jgi:hypothetical protein
MKTICDQVIANIITFAIILSIASLLKIRTERTLTRDGLITTISIIKKF